MITSTLELTGLSGERLQLAPEQFDRLLSRIEGPLLHPGEAGFDDAIRLWNGMVTKVPALVLQPTSARDVATAIEFASNHGILISIKGGGHNIAGTAMVEAGLALDMSRMREVSVDPDRRLAHVGAGCLLQDVDRATQQHSLATVLGFVSETGVAGLTLGGGLGYLTRRFGYAVDNLEEVEIVTADGRIRTANRREHADLFWAVRGGGGNFGVVTRFSFRLHDVGPTVLGGLIAWPFERAREVLRTYRSLTAEAPRELAVWMVLLRAPAAPFVPSAWHGRRVCAMVVCYSGDPAGAEDALKPIRALEDPVLDLVHEQPYVQVQSFLDQTEPAGHHYYWKTNYVQELSEGLLSEMQRLFEECPIPEAQIGLLHLEGALNERAQDDGAVGNRDVRFALGVNGMWAPDEPDAASFRDWIREASEKLRPYSAGRTYINFQTADEDQDRIRATYGANFSRLVAMKQKYDPGNLFRMNRNIQAKS